MVQEHFLLLYIYNRRQTKEYGLTTFFELLGLLGHFSANLSKLEQAGYITSILEENTAYKLRIFYCTELGTEAVAKIDREQVAKEILKIAPEHLKAVVNFGIYGKTDDHISNAETKPTPN